MVLETYLKDINKIKLLSPKKEKELAKKIVKGDKQAREEMVKANLRLVVNIAKKYTNCGLPFQDLIEEGNIGLLKAVERFDPDRNCRFSTYATWWIKQSILRALTDSSKVVRIPSYMREVLNKAETLAEHLTLEKGLAPTIREVASSLEKNHGSFAKTENILKLSSSLAHIQSLDKICEQKEIIEDPNANQETMNAEDVERLQVLLKNLDEKKQQILKMRFGLDNHAPLTLQEISLRIELSRERVRQIIKESLAQLRTLIHQRESN